MKSQLPVICLMGPTACGKTDLAIEFGATSSLGNY